eukprot:scaffold2705_cov109-Isochrysis_galbana.AAC.3
MAVSTGGAGRRTLVGVGMCSGRASGVQAAQAAAACRTGGGGRAGGVCEEHVDNVGEGLGVGCWLRKGGGSGTRAIELPSS